jgi:hypothetical protein
MAHAKNLFQLSKEEVVSAVADGLKWSPDMRRRFESIPAAPCGAQLLKWSREAIINWIGNSLRRKEQKRATDYMMRMLHNFRLHFYFDHFLGKHIDFPVNDAFLRLDEMARPRFLAHVALWFHARAFIDRPLPFPRALAHVVMWFDDPLKFPSHKQPEKVLPVFLPAQLRRFMWGFVDSTARKLVQETSPDKWKTSPAAAAHMRHRVIGGYFSSVEVRPSAA